MPINFKCSECGHRMRAADSRAGKPVKCPKCGDESTVPKPLTWDVDGDDGDPHVGGHGYGGDHGDDAGDSGDE